MEDDFYLQQRRVLHLPGGGTDGESPAVAGRRELAEETGFVAKRVEYLATLGPLPGATVARLHLFVATGLTAATGPGVRDVTEDGMTATWWPVQEAVAAACTGRITDAASVVGLLLVGAASPSTSASE
ncbi:NUDIX domain-containing protein [Streptomyces sp. Iso 434]|uniref:NUDIX domain-containing protein n=1 Tax=Streptomyces sp. Iso 434 TaxID=3062272 RepID=UPI00397FEA27